MKLKSLLEGVRTLTIRGDADVEVTAVTGDSRRCRKGSVFVAIGGYNVDGASFAESAAANGAVAIVSSHAPREVGATWVQVDDSRAALATIAANFYGQPAKRIELIGVTGTSGKTTTTKMIESVLDATGDPVGLIGTIEYRAGENREIADRTTPDAVVLQEWFARMAEAGVRHAVMEVSSHALALKRTYGVPFAAAVFTNLSRDHFDFHKDFEDYFAAKRILFDQIDTTRRSAIVNIDDEYGRRLASELGGDVVLSFGTGKNADVRPADGFRCDIDGLNGIVETPAGSVRVRSQLIGMPNLYNWLGAIGASIVVGISLRTIEEGIEKLKSVRGRFEKVSGTNVPILIDYAHKPDALEKLLRSVRELAPGRKIVLVFGCGGNRDQGKRPVMGEIAARLADFSIVTSDNPRNESPEAIVAQIEEGFASAGKDNFETVLDRREAIERATAMAAADSSTVVVVAGKGHESYQVIGDRIVHFDDREEVEIALQKLAENGKIKTESFQQ